MAHAKINVTIWNEFLHEQNHAAVKKIYPQGIHQTIAQGLSAIGAFKIRTATLEEPEHGLSDQVLKETDVMLWWGHMAHDQVKDAIVDKVQHRVLDGMGLIVLHSGHYSKIFRRLMGTHCSLRWREAAEKERFWNIAPNHPITQGLGDYFELPNEEMYGERFDVPEPDELIFISWFEGGEVFRSGCTWRRGHGKIFYFRPGHETYPTYHNPQVIRVIGNAVRWAKPERLIPYAGAPKSEPLEKLSQKDVEFGSAGVVQNI